MPFPKFYFPPFFEFVEVPFDEGVIIGICACCNKGATPINLPYIMPKVINTRNRELKIKILYLFVDNSTSVFYLNITYKIRSLTGSVYS